MTDQLISLETAKLAKEKGFDIITDKEWVEFLTDEVLFDYRNGEDFVSVERGTTRIQSRIYDQNYAETRKYPAPTQSLLQRWLREQHYVYLIIKKEFIGSDEWVWAYRIEYLPKDKWGEKRRSPYFLEKESFQESPGGTYWGAWDSYEEALEAGLLKALKLV